jgi:uncharacterized protein (TIGR01244 family)
MHRIWARRRALLFAIGISACVAGGFFAHQFITNNFHTVVAGELYRSAQPSPTDLARYKADFGVATILNLRGANPGKPWYDEEIAAARKLGVTVIDIPLSASRELSPNEVTGVIAAMKSAQKPLLIHCKSGADRSGLASALYLASIARVGEEQAEGQLSMRYGHVSVPYFPAYAMDETFETAEPMMGFHDS